MKKSKFSPVVSLVVIALVVVGASYLIKRNSKDITEEVKVPEQTTKEEVLKTIDKSLAIDKKYTAPDKYASFNVTYPQFKNASPELNAEIESMVMTGIAQHKKDSADNWQARYETSTPAEKVTEFPTAGQKFNYDVSWSAVQLNQNFISVIVKTSAYTGGAHGYEVAASLNYDVKNKKEVTLQDLFSNDPNYLKTISDYSREDLKKQFRKKLSLGAKEEFSGGVLDMLYAGTEPTAENFSVFTFADSAVTIYFNQYQVAPYAMGESQVVMPRS